MLPRTGPPPNTSPYPPRSGVVEHKQLLADMFAALVPEGLRFLRRHLKETVATVGGHQGTSGSHTPFLKLWCP